jgi:hypothetical protein
MHGKKNLMLIMAVCFMVLASACAKKKGAANTAEGKGIFKQKMLIGLEIVSIELVKMPRYGKDGERWDSWAPLAAEPDVFVRLSQYNRPIFTSEVKEEHAVDTKVSFQKAIPFSVTAFSEKILIEVFDEDGMTDDDNVGYLTWYPLDSQNKELVQLTTEDKGTVVQLGLRWVYE